MGMKVSGQSECAANAGTERHKTSESTRSPAGTRHFAGSLESITASFTTASVYGDFPGLPLLPPILHKARGLDGLSINTRGREWKAEGKYIISKD
jgi:hypothetical protein